MIEILQIDEAHSDVLSLKNEPFSMPGRLIPSLRDGRWSYREELFDKPRQMCFPNEAYDFSELSRDGAAFGAFENGQCIGLAVYKKHFFSYLYLLDLKVSASARGRGVGRQLIDAGMTLAGRWGYRGVFLQAQDDNLNACRFYLHCGFQIGGFDNRVYAGTKQEGKADVVFYLDR